MLNDPVQMLIDAGAIPQNPFDAASRYNGVPLALLPQAPDMPPVAYVRRRFMSPLHEMALAGRVSISSSDRPDLIAHRVYGEPLAWWRIADANTVTDPFELTDTPGARIAIPIVNAG